MKLGIIVSSRSNDPRSAQQVAVLVVLPLIGLVVTQAKGILVLTPGAVAAGSVVLAVIDILILRAGTTLFRRETILTRRR